MKTEDSFMYLRFSAAARTPEGTRLHFLSQMRKKIEVRLGLALAGNAHPRCI